MLPLLEGSSPEVLQEVHGQSEHIAANVGTASEISADLPDAVQPIVAAESGPFLQIVRYMGKPLVTDTRD